MIKKLSLGFLVSSLVAACATTNEDTPKGAAKFAGDARLGEKVDRVCFNRTIDSFLRNDRDTLVIREGVNDHYLIEVRGICSNLRHAQSIGFASALSCVTRNDHIIVSTSPFTLKDRTTPPQRCMISEIYEWNEDALEDSEPDDDGAAPDEDTAPTAL